ncbi:MAG: prephenate dehydrogenase/arogenate dehydrogenase family protein, partial [Alphaproteobacteria bacterium]|nr:prephenate dehydrogenase/arogenate dehydrogenase family protein [Alphaproteobacteria bacterium]
MSASPPFARIVIAGIGLIGSSLALAIKAGGLAGHVVGLDADARVREVATKLGIVDSIGADPEAAVRGANLVVLAVPVRAIGALVQAMAPGLAPGTIVTDTGSVKRAVIEAVAPHLPAGVHLVPGHPVAGTNAIAQQMRDAGADIVIALADLAAPQVSALRATGAVDIVIATQGREQESGFRIEGRTGSLAVGLMEGG